MKTFYKTSLLLILNSHFLIFNSFSQQAPGIEWAKCLGGSDRDEAHSVQQTKDGGYIVGGMAYSTDGDITANKGLNDFWIVKLDNASNIQWQKNFGGTNNDYAYSIQQTFDSGYIISGHTNSGDGDVTGYNGGGNNYWIVKLDSVGTLQWQHCLGGTNLDQSYSIVQSSDSGYLAVGYTISNDSDVTGNHGGQDIWAVKLDTSGIMQWRKCYGGTSNDQAYSVNQCKDGGYIIAGRTQSNDGDVSGFHGLEDYWIIKIDPLGTLEWQKCYGGTNSERAHCISKTSNGGYIITGFTLSNDGDVSGNHGNQDVWTVKIDSAGTIQWQKCYGGSDRDEGNFITETLSGGYILAGLTYSNNGDVTGNHGQDDYWILKLDVNGNIEWQKCLGGTLDDIAYGIGQTSDGGYITAGVSLSNDGDVSGNHDTTGGASYIYDYWIVKLFSDTITGISPSQSASGGEGVAIAPNPSTGIFQITFPSSSNQKTNYTLEVINTLGQKVFTSPLTPLQRRGEANARLDLSFLPEGIYVLKINDGVLTTGSKIIIE